jgi:hypothetical protein
MKTEKTSTREILRIMPALIILLANLTVSCHKRPPKAMPPASKSQPAARTLTDFEMGEASYAAGNYAAAASSYEASLINGSAKDQDRAFFHLGLAYALQGTTPQYFEQSQRALQRLVQQYPGSPYISEATLLLSLQAEIKRLAGGMDAQQAELNNLKIKRQAEIDGLKNALKEQQAKINALTEELQQLRNIDMERRPSRPPR